MAKGFGVSPITNTIYFGTQNPEKQMWTGKKEDVTNEVIAAIFEWFRCIGVCSSLDNIKVEDG